MTEKIKHEQQLWNIANTLRGKMGADNFRDYTLGLIFHESCQKMVHTDVNALFISDSHSIIPLKKTGDFFAWV